MKNNKGFTLLEVIMASFLFAVIAGAVGTFTAYYFKNYQFSFEENQQIAQAQGTMTYLIHEIREARNADDGSWPLVQTDDNTLIFFSDVTNDGRTDRVRYFLNGTDLQRGVIQPTTVPVTYPTANEVINTVVSNVDTSGGAIFSYYNGNWPGDTTNNPLIAANRLLNTRFIRVHIRINVSSNYGPQPFDNTSGVQIRSMKDNL